MKNNPSPTTMKECKYKYGEITKDVCHCHCLEHGYVRCVHQDYTNTKCQHCQPSEERVSSEWEKEFEWTFTDYRNDDSLGYMATTMGDVWKLKKFIKDLLQQRDKELIGKIEKMKGSAEHHAWEQMRRQSWGYNEALDDVIKLVKGGGV